MLDMGVVCLSNELFPLFSNRLLPKSRPEYRDYLKWLGLDENKTDEMEMLARSGGQRATDTLEIVPCPEPSANNSYEVYFFSHGLRHLSEKDQERAAILKVGERCLQPNRSVHIRHSGIHASHGIFAKCRCSKASIAGNSCNTRPTSSSPFNSRSLNTDSMSKR